MRSDILPFKISTALILFILLFSKQNIFAQSGWTSTFSNPAYNFYSVQFVDLKNGVALADSLRFPYLTYTNIFRTTDGGNSWSRILDYDGAGDNRLNGLFIGPDSTFFAYGYKSKILRSTDFGLSWSVVNSSFSTFWIKFGGQFINSNTGFVSGEDSIAFPWIWKTTNKGLSWIKIGEPLSRPIQSFNQSQFLNENTGWVSSFGIYGGPAPSQIYYCTVLEKTTNGGLNWFVVNTFYNVPGSGIYNFKFNFFNYSIGWFFSQNKIIKTTNGGINWFDYHNISLTANVLHMVDENTGWASDGVNLYKTTNGAVNWFIQYTGVNSQVKAFSYLDSNNAWFCGYGGSIYKTTNGGGIITAINPVSSNIPDGYSLHQNYPNPFNPTTKINFDLKNSAFTMLRVYDITGREVKTLVNEKISAGSYSYDFNASELPSGVYFYQLQTDGFIETKKMILLK